MPILWNSRGERLGTNIICLRCSVNQTSRSDDPQILQYATPSFTRRHPFLAALVAIVGICLGLFGLLLLFEAALAATFYFAEGNSRDFAGDLSEVALVLLLGLIRLYVSNRLFRAAHSIFAGR
jgi:hypothetical protein